MPFASRWRATRLQVWWQTGQFGTRMAASAPSSRQRRRISGASVSIVTRWLRLVGAPWKRGVTAPTRPCRGGAQQGRQREPRAAVFGGGVGAVVADMRDSQVVRLRRVAGVDLVELRPAVVGRAGPLVALVGPIGCGGGDNGHARAGERLAQRRERRLDVMRPAIGRGVADRRVVLAGALHVGDRRVVVRREAEEGVEVAVHGVITSFAGCDHGPDSARSIDGPTILRTELDDASREPAFARRS